MANTPYLLLILSSLLWEWWQCSVCSPVWFMTKAPYLLFSHPVPEEWQFSLITSHLNPPSGDFTALQQSNWGETWRCLTVQVRYFRHCNIFLLKHGKMLLQSYLKYRLFKLSIKIYEMTFAHLQYVKINNFCNSGSCNFSSFLFLYFSFSLLFGLHPLGWDEFQEISREREWDQKRGHFIHELPYCI